MVDPRFWLAAALLVIGGVIAIWFRHFSRAEGVIHFDGPSRVEILRRIRATQLEQPDQRPGPKRSRRIPEDGR